MNLNTHIIREALGLPAIPWTPKQLTQLDISHVEVLTEEALGNLDPHVLYLVPQEERALFEAAEGKAHVCVVCTHDAPSGLVPGNPRASWGAVDEGGVLSVLNKITRLFAHFDAWDRELVRASADAGSVESFLDLGQQAIGYPICLLGLDLTMIARSSMEFEHTGSYWRFYDGLGYYPLDEQAKDNFDVSFVNDVYGGRMTQGSYPSDPKHCYLDIAVMKEGAVCLWLSVVGPVLGLSCARASLVRWFRDRLEGSFVVRAAGMRGANPVAVLVQDLLDGVEVEEQVFRRRLSSRGFGRHDHFVVIGFKRLGPAYDQTFKRMMLTQFVQDSMPKAVLVERAGEPFFILDFEEHEGIPDELIRHLEGLAQSVGCQIAVSSMTDDFADIAFAFAQVDETALHLEPGLEPGVHPFSDVFGRLTTSALLERYPLQELCHPLVLSLMRDEAGYGGELVACLLAYLELNGNVSGVAERLVTHRNTVRYRMRKIEERLGKSIEQLGASERLQLLMSCWMVTSVAG